VAHPLWFAVRVEVPGSLDQCAQISLQRSELADVTAWRFPVVPERDHAANLSEAESYDVRADQGKPIDDTGVELPLTSCRPCG
jgi:hypothetical protein